jgi:hypothetical protein
MFKKILGFVAVSVVVSGVAGCGAPQGADFIGHWEGGTSKAPYKLDIKESGGVYHVDQEFKTIFSLEVERNKLEAVPLSNEVLEVRDLAGGSMRLENNHLYFDGQEYTKKK